MVELTGRYWRSRAVTCSEDDMSLFLSRIRNEIFYSFENYLSVFFLFLHAATRKIVAPSIVVCIPCIIQFCFPFIAEVIAKQDVGFCMPINIVEEYTLDRGGIEFLSRVFQESDGSYEGGAKFSRSLIEFGLLEKLKGISMVYLDKLDCIKVGLSDEFPRKEISQDCSKTSASKRDDSDYNIFHIILASIVGNAIAAIGIYICFKYFISPER